MRIFVVEELKAMFPRVKSNAIDVYLQIINKMKLIPLYSIILS